MLQLIYVSTATQEMGTGDLADLLRTSRQNNDRLNISGLLLYRKDAFLQVIEGQEPVVDQLYERIRADERHRDVTTLSRTDIEARDFPDWAMAFRGLGGLEHADVPGFTPFTSEEAILERVAGMSGTASETVQRFLEIEV